MDWDKFKQTLCDDLRPNAIDATNPYVTINSVMPMVKSQAAEITRLKAELELRTKERDQAIELGGIMEYNGSVWAHIASIVTEGQVECGMYRKECPELYAHLAGKVEG